MSEHATPWLAAYHDGELKGHRVREVEAHLAQCARCRAELEQLQVLAALLQESPAAENLTPAERFVGQVELQLPRRPERSAWQRALETGWRLAPLALLGAWVFVQAVLVVSGVALYGLRMGLGGSLLADLLPSSRTLWLEQFPGLSSADLDDVGRVAWHLLGSGRSLGLGPVLALVSSAAIGLVYWSWLASWWARRQHRVLFRHNDA